MVRWHRQAWQLVWRWKSRPRLGRPRVSQEARELIAMMSRENPRWGTERIRGEFLKLGIAVSTRSIRRYRGPRPSRPPSQTWRTFLANHRPRIWAADLCIVQTLTFKTLYVRLFIAHGRRELVHWNVTASPTAAWVWRQLIEATPWGRTPRYLLRDRDAVYGGDFVPRARRLGIEAVLTPVRAPRANVIAERVVGTLRRECLDRLIILGRYHREAVLREFLAHYSLARPRRALDLRPPLAGEGAIHVTGEVVRRDRLGGLIHEYLRRAA